MDGVYRKKEPVGYCRFDGHRGLLDVGLLKKKQCLKKGCNYLCRYEQHQYWKLREFKKRDKKERKKAKEQRGRTLYDFGDNVDGLLREEGGRVAEGDRCDSDAN